MKKPVGISGPCKLKVQLDGSPKCSFNPIKWPGTKAEAERAIVDRFIGSMNRRLSRSGEKFFLSDPLQNAENGFDFTIRSPKGMASLELMEIAPLKGPYEQAPSIYKVEELAHVIFQCILKKSTRYPRSNDKELF